MRRPLLRPLRVLLWTAVAASAGLVAGLAWEDFDRQAEPLQIAVGANAMPPSAGQDPTHVEGVTLTISNRALWPVSLETRCRFDTDRRTLDTVWMNPTRQLWILRGDHIRCTLPPGPAREDATVTLYWTPFLHAVVGRCLQLGSLGEHPSQPIDLPGAAPAR